MTIPIDRQIAAVGREIGMRKHVYPQWTAAKKMTAEKAAAETAAMEAVYATLSAIPLLVSACQELLHHARERGADPDMLDRCSAALRAAGDRI